MSQRRLALLIWQAIGDPSSCAAVLWQRASHVGNCEQVYVCLAMTAGRRLTAGASCKSRATKSEHAVLPDPGYGFLLGDWGLEVSGHDHIVDGICVFGVRVG